MMGDGNPELAIRLTETNLLRSRDNHQDNTEMVTAHYLKRRSVCTLIPRL